MVLEQEIEQRSASEEQASIIYVDLDHFKAYNDTYGFEAGDRMIRMLADVLQWAVRRHGKPRRPGWPRRGRRLRGGHHPEQSRAPVPGGGALLRPALAQLL